MKYLLIQNDGLIEVNALRLIGGSTKRGDPDSIGFYGTGNKYSIANMLRKGIKFKMFSGNDEIIFNTRPVLLKDKTLQEVYITFQGVEYNTSTTTDAGPDWDTWFIVREFYCNALDEGGAEVKPGIEDHYVTGMIGVTRIYVEMVQEVVNVLNHWNGYFTNNRYDLIEELTNKDGKIVKIFHKYSQSATRIYRKGILVYENEKDSLFDYDLSDAEIDESRVLRNDYTARWTIEESISESASPSLLLQVLRGLDAHEREHKPLFESTFDLQPRRNIPNWTAALQGIPIYNSNKKDIYKKEIDVDPDCLLVSSTLARYIADFIPGKIVYGIPRKGLAHSYKSLLINEKQSQVLNKAMEFLILAGFDFGNMTVEATNFDDYSTMGMADFNENKIHIGVSAFDKGLKQVVETLMEEHAHLISRMEDETRNFQNYLLSQWLNEIEERLGITL